MFNRLKQLRQEKKLTTRELAELYGVSHASISRAETGDRNLNDDDIKFFTSFFNVSSDYLLGLSDFRHSKTPTDIKLAFYNQEGIVTQEQQKMVDDFIAMIKKVDNK